MNKQYTQEEKNAFIAGIKEWKSKLVKVPNKNIYLHPDFNYKAWYAIKSGNFWNHKAYSVIDGAIRYTKNGISEEIILSSLINEYLTVKETENPFI